VFAVRLTATIILGLATLLFAYAAFTVPAIAATPYLILALVLGAATFFARPHRASK